MSNGGDISPPYFYWNSLVACFNLWANQSDAHATCIPALKSVHLGGISTGPNMDQRVGNKTSTYSTIPCTSILNCNGDSMQMVWKEMRQQNLKILKTDTVFTANHGLLTTNSHEIPNFLRYQARAKGLLRYTRKLVLLHVFYFPISFPAISSSGSDICSD